MLLAKMYIVVSNIALLWDGDGFDLGDIGKILGDGIGKLISGAGDLLSAGWDEATNMAMPVIKAGTELISSFMVAAFGKLINGFVSSGFNTYSELMNESFTYLDSGLVEGKFEGFADIVKNASTSVIVPIAALIVTYSFMYNLIQIMVDRNNQAEVDWFMICKECFKAACCAVLVSHSFEIAGAMKELGDFIAGSARDIHAYSITLEADVIGETYSSGGEMLLVALVGFVAIICGYICAALIRFTIYTRIITLNLLIGLAPIPFATFLAGGWIGQIGQGYIKSLISYALQIFIMTLIGSMMTRILGSAAFKPTIPALLEHVIMLFALTQTFMKSLSIAKTVMSAA